jgi:hypothetical protein
MDIMDTPMLADLWDLAALWDVALRDVVPWLGTASQDTAPSRAEGSTVADSTAADSVADANNGSGHLTIGSSKFKGKCF